MVWVGWRRHPHHRSAVEEFPRRPPTTTYTNHPHNRRSDPFPGRPAVTIVRNRHSRWAGGADQRHRPRPFEGCFGAVNSLCVGVDVKVACVADDECRRSCSVAHHGALHKHGCPADHIAFAGPVPPPRSIDCGRADVEVKVAMPAEKIRRPPMAREPRVARDDHADQSAMPPPCTCYLSVDCFVYMSWVGAFFFFQRRSKRINASSRRTVLARPSSDGSFPSVMTWSGVDVENPPFSWSVKTKI